MKKMFVLFRRCIWLGLLLGSSAWAQLDAQAPIKMSDAERQRWQAILDAPVDSNSLLSKRSDQYREKNLAAVKLGDNSQREKYLREWASFSPDTGKWNLFSYLAMTEKRQEAYQLGHELIQSVKYPPSALRIRTQVAGYYIDDSNLKEAASLIDAAENIARVDMRNMQRRSTDAFWIARADVELYLVKSRLSMRLGKWNEGIENAKIAVEKAKSLTKMASLAPNDSEKMWGYGMAVWATQELAAQQIFAGLYADAEWSLRDSHKMAQEFGFNENQMVGFYNRVSDLYLATGQYQAAAGFSARSEKIVLSQGYEKGTPLWLFTRMRTNAALVGSDQWQEAQASFDMQDAEALRMKASRSLSGQTQLRSYVYLKTGRHDEALRILRGTLRYNTDNFGEDHYFTAMNRGMMAVALSKTGNEIEARAEFSRALKNMASPESLTGDYVETAIQIKLKRFVLQSYLQLLAKTAVNHAQDAEIIFQVADQLNTSKVQQALAEAAVRSGVTTPGLSDIIRQEQDAKNEISSLTNYISGQGSEEEKRRTPQVIEQMRARMKQLEVLRKEYKAQIQKRYPEYFQLIQPKAPSREDIAQQLQADELFIAVIPMEERTYVWSIDAKGGINFHSANLGENDLRDLVGRVRKTLDVAAQGSSAPSFDQVSAYKIYQSIFGPLDSQIQGKKHLVISASGALAQLPFAVLPRIQVSANAMTPVPWLMRDVALSHVPTANGWLSLKRLGKQPSATQPLLAWGDPLFDAKATQVASNHGSTVRSVLPTRAATSSQNNLLSTENYVAYSQIPALPETREEVQELATILGANPKQDLILGAEATRASVLKNSSSGNLARKQVVVFATHGLLAGDLPHLNQPALAMASTKDPNESPLLTLEDVLGLKLNADWVVLSACNTAGADGRAEEALSGLARGFFYAGSRSLLVTHWSVESESAMLLTTHTFAAYKKNPQMRRAEALRQAMLETMKDKRFSHPAYWAPYALVGEGGR